MITQTSTNYDYIKRLSPSGSGLVVSERYKGRETRGPQRNAPGSPSPPCLIWRITGDPTAHRWNTSEPTTIQWTCGAYRLLTLLLHRISHYTCRGASHLKRKQRSRMQLPNRPRQTGSAAEARSRRTPAADAAPETRAPLEALSAPHPIALRPPLDLVPPLRFALVEEKLYRGGYPTLRHFPFLQTLKLNAILSMTPERPTYDLERFAAAENIQVQHIQVERFKGDVLLSPADLSAALQFVLNADNYPLYMHCLDGRHVVGMLVLALRRLRNWDSDSSRAEYLRYADEIQDDLSAVNDFSGPVHVTGRLPAWIAGKECAAGDDRLRRRYTGGIKLKSSELADDNGPSVNRSAASPVTPITPFVSFASALHGAGRPFTELESGGKATRESRPAGAVAARDMTRYVVVEPEGPRLVAEASPSPSPSPGPAPLSPCPAGSYATEEVRAGDFFYPPPPPPRAGSPTSRAEHPPKINRSITRNNNHGLDGPDLCLNAPPLASPSPPSQSAPLSPPFLLSFPSAASQRLLSLCYANAFRSATDFPAAIDTPSPHRADDYNLFTYGYGTGRRERTSSHRSTPRTRASSHHSHSGAEAYDDCGEGRSSSISSSRYPRWDDGAFHRDEHHSFGLGCGAYSPRVFLGRRRATSPRHSTQRYPPQHAEQGFCDVPLHVLSAALGRVAGHEREPISHPAAPCCPFAQETAPLGSSTSQRRPAYPQRYSAGWDYDVGPPQKSRGFSSFTPGPVAEAAPPCEGARQPGRPSPFAAARFDFEQEEDVKAYFRQQYLVDPELRYRPRSRPSRTPPAQGRQAPAPQPCTPRSTREFEYTPGRSVRRRAATHSSQLGASLVPADSASTSDYRVWVRDPNSYSGFSPRRSSAPVDACRCHATPPRRSRVQLSSWREANTDGRQARPHRLLSSADLSALGVPAGRPSSRRSTAVPSRRGNALQNASPNKTSLLLHSSSQTSYSLWTPSDFVWNPPSSFVTEFMDSAPLLIVFTSLYFASFFTQGMLWRRRLPTAQPLRGRLSAVCPTLVAQQCQCSSGSAAYDPHVARVQEKYPVIQLPARSLWSEQYPIPKGQLTPQGDPEGCTADMIQRVKDTRRYYQYPSLCAPQIGWNVQMFTLFDNTVYINPVCLDTLEWAEEAEKKGIPYALRAKGKTCFAWEPCASCAFLLHYIERPLTCAIQALDEGGRIVTQTLEGMRARMAWHEMDHLRGILFSRRAVDANHVVPLEGFCTMSDWSDDYPSLEARSTFLYTCFTPPFTFTSFGVEDANLLDRHLEDGIYPGKERDEQMRIEHAALEQLQRDRWRREKKRQAEKTCVTEAQEGGEEGRGEEPPPAPTASQQQ
eukprot:gene9113-6404_t